MSIPVMLYVIVVNALYIALGNSESAATGVALSFNRSAIRVVYAKVTVAGSITATTVAAMPLVPGGGGTILDPADSIIVLARIDVCQAVAIFIAGVAGSGDGTLAMIA